MATLMPHVLALVCLTSRPGYTSNFLVISVCQCIRFLWGQYWGVTMIILFSVPSQCQNLAGKVTEQKLLRS